MNILHVELPGLFAPSGLPVYENVLSESQYPLFQAGQAIATAVARLDSANMHKLGRGLGLTWTKMSFVEFAEWAYNDIPSYWTGYAYAALLMGVEPTVIQDTLNATKQRRVEQLAGGNHD